jgi:hypothetical protein
MFEGKSPNGRNIITVFRRDCGPTSDFVTIVQLRQSKKRFKAIDYRYMVFQMRGEHKMRVRWDGNEHVILSWPKSRWSPVWQLIKMSNIQISYEEDSTLEAR